MSVSGAYDHTNSNNQLTNKNYYICYSFPTYHINTGSRAHGEAATAMKYMNMDIKLQTFTHTQDTTYSVSIVGIKIVHAICHKVSPFG